MDISRITEQLYVGRTPMTADDYYYLKARDVSLVINMRMEHRPVPAPQDTGIRTLWLRTIDHPFFPIPIRHLVRGTRSAMNEISHGGKVLSHCYAGVHRSVALACCVLVAQGMQPDQAMSLVKQQRAIADPEIPYIKKRILKFAGKWAAQED